MTDRSAPAQTDFRPPRQSCRLLLVYPEIPGETYWSYGKALSLIGCKSLLPPLGLLTVANMLPATCELQLVDMNVETLSDKQLAWADAVFVSAMLVQKDSFEKVVERAQASGTPIVAGGPYPSSAYQTIPGVDHFVIGEAEGVLDRFWADFAAGRAKKAYVRCPDGKDLAKPIAFFGPEDVVHVDGERPDLSEAPVPRFDLARMSAYKSMAVQTSRGCPVGCEFCDIWRRFGKKPRYKPVDRILAELEQLYALGWRRSVFVVDDNFIGNRRKAKEILSAIADWQKAHGCPFDFCTEATLTLADDEELLDGMRRAGFDMVFIGIESPVEASLQETGKQINTTRDMATRVREIQRHGIQVTAGFILGFDNDPEDVGEQMADCINKLGIPTAMVGLLLALPETNLYERLEREGRIQTESAGNNTHAFEINFQTRRPVRRVIADYKRLLQELYPPKLTGYFKRCAILRDQWQPSPHPQRSLRWFEVRACLRYFAVLMRRSYRWNALRFLAETLWRKPAFFPVAVSLGIQGHHFRTITRQAFEVVHLTSFFAERLEEFQQLARVHRELGQRSVHDALDRLAATREEILREARKRYRRVSRDARRALHGHYVGFRDQIEDLYAQTAHSVTAAGV